MKKSWIVVAVVLMLSFVMLLASCTEHQPPETTPDTTTAETPTTEEPTAPVTSDTPDSDETTADPGEEETTVDSNVGEETTETPGGDIPVTYYVTFLQNDGSMLKRRIVKHGEAADAPEAPVIEGYTFVRWDTDFSHVTENLVVRPVYEKIKGPDPSTQDITTVFQSDLSQYAGTPNDTLEMSATDIATYLHSVQKPLGTTYLTDGYYATGGFGTMTRVADGRWAMTMSIVDVDANIPGTSDPAMVARCYNAAQIGMYEEIWGMYESDGDSSAESGGFEHGGATGIHLSFHHGKIFLFIKALDLSNPTLYSKGVRNYTFVLSDDAEGKIVTLADDGHNVYVYINGELSATVAFSGSVEYDDVFCLDGNFAETAEVTLADGTSTTVPNTLCADTASAHFGLAWRHGVVLYDSLKVQGFTTYDPATDVPAPGSGGGNNDKPDVPVTKNPDDYDKIASSNAAMWQCGFVDVTQGSWQTFTSDRPIHGVSFWAATQGTAELWIYKVEDGVAPADAMKGTPALEVTFSGGTVWFDEALPEGRYVMQFNNFFGSYVYDGRIMYHRFYGHTSTTDEFIQLNNGGTMSENVICLQLLVTKAEEPAPDDPNPDAPNPDEPNPDTPSGEGLIDMEITQNTDDYDKIASSDAQMWQCSFVDITPGSWQSFTTDRTMVGISFWQNCSGTATVSIYKIADGSTAEEAVQGTPVIQGTLSDGKVWFDKGLVAGNYVMKFDNMSNCANYNGTPYLRFYGHDSRTDDMIVLNKGGVMDTNVICLKLLVTKAVEPDQPDQPDEPTNDSLIDMEITRNTDDYDKIASSDAQMWQCSFVDLTAGSWQSFTTDRTMVGISFWQNCSGTATVSIYKIADGSTAEEAVQGTPVIQGTLSDGKVWFDKGLAAGNYVMKFDNMSNCANYNGTPYLRFYGHDSRTDDMIVLNKGGVMDTNVICLQLLVTKAVEPDQPDQPDEPTNDSLIDMEITQNTDDYDKIASSDAQMYQCSFVDLTPGSWQSFTTDRTMVGISFWQDGGGTATVSIYKVEDGSTPEEALKGTPVIQGTLTDGKVWFDKGLAAGNYVMRFDSFEDSPSYNGTSYLRFYGYTSKTSDFIICNKGGTEIMAEVVCLKLLVAKAE